MLIPLKFLVTVFGVAPKLILHVGAHEGEEFDDYVKYGCEKVIWVEAQPEKVRALKARFSDDPRVEVIEATVWNEEGVDLKLKVTNMTQSSSILNLGTHAVSYPDIKVAEEISVRTSRLDSLISEPIDLLALDIQGVELQALQGFEQGIKRTKWIYTEVNRVDVYENASLVSDLDAFLAIYHFKRVATRWTMDGWGDALYIGESQKNFSKMGYLLVWIPSQVLYRGMLLLQRLHRFAFNFKTS